MRYVTVSVTPTKGASFHPLGQALADAGDVTREAVHRVELIADGTGVMLAEARGNRERYESILADSEYVHQYAVTGAEGRWYAYLQFEPNEINRQMLEQRQASPVMMEMPIEFDERGRMVITFVGDEGAFDEAVPPDDAYEIELLETGERPPKGDDLFASLTERQQTVLETAIELGYYENPREATQAEIADAVGSTAGTVGEHLRKIEHRVFSQFS